MNKSKSGRDSKSNQKRKHIRKLIPIGVNIFDSLKGYHVGHLVNITLEGMMVIADREISTDCIFQYEMCLPVVVKGVEKIVVGVDCLWCQPADQKDKFWAGYHIIDISDSDMETLENLIEKHGEDIGF